MQKERLLTKVNEVPTLNRLGAITTLPMETMERCREIGKERIQFVP
jgi:hypothetical protein